MIIKYFGVWSNISWSKIKYGWPVSNQKLSISNRKLLLVYCYKAMNLLYRYRTWSSSFVYILLSTRFYYVLAPYKAVEITVSITIWTNEIESFCVEESRWSRTFHGDIKEAKSESSMSVRRQRLREQVRAGSPCDYFAISCDY